MSNSSKAVPEPPFADTDECRENGKDLYCPEGPGWLRVSKQDIVRLYRQIAVLWDFIAESDQWGDAKDYLEDHLDEEFPIPFSFLL